MVDEDALMRLTEASKAFPDNPSPDAIRYWIKTGALSNSGKRVYMEKGRLPGRTAVSLRMYREFIEKLND